jgi:hypothetical protein
MTRFVITDNLDADFRGVGSKIVCDNITGGVGAPTGPPPTQNKVWLWINTTTNQTTHYWNTTTNQWVVLNAVADSDHGSGTAFPASPSTGDYFYRTDLQAQFWYDGTRSAWLGDLETLEFTANDSNNDLYIGNCKIDNLAFQGFRLPYSTRIVRVYSSSEELETATISTYVNGATAYNLNIVNSRDAASPPLNIAWSAGQLLNAAISATSSGNLRRIIFRISYRRLGV